MITLLMTTIYLVFVSISSLVFFIIALLIWAVTKPFDKKLVALHIFSSFWGALYLWIMPLWSTTVSGRKNVVKGRTYVIVSNHQSQLDILLAYSLFFPFKWVSKAEVFKIPFIGWNMGLNEYIRIHRGRRDSIRKLMVDCKRTLEEGKTVYFFPEGTRSETGKVGEFKAGAFALAKRLKLPILPIVINGSKNALPKNGMSLKGRHAMKIDILQEIPYETFADKSSDEITVEVRDLIASKVDEHRI